MADKKKLTPKQEAFCQEYMKDMNATQAYIRAGYAPKDAAVSSCQLLRNPKIKANIAELTAEATKRNQLTVDDVIGVWRDVISNKEGSEANKLIAARDAGKYFGLFIDKQEIEHKGEINLFQIKDIRAHKKD